MAKKSAQKSAGMGKKARKTSNGSQRKEKDTSFSSMQSELMSKTLELIQLKDIIGQAFKHLQGLTRELDRADHKLTVKEVMKLLQVDGPKKGTGRYSILNYGCSMSHSWRHYARNFPCYRIRRYA